MSYFNDWQKERKQMESSSDKEVNKNKNNKSHRPMSVESMQETNKFLVRKKLKLEPFLINVLIGTIIGISMEILPNLYLEPYCRGFYCNDLTIQLPYKSTYNLLGVVLTLLLTIPTKFIVGELRPIFLDICNPLYDNIYCHNNSYIINYKCRGNNYDQTVKEARLSFFSGHASLAMTAAVFFMIYMQSRIPRGNDLVIIIIKPIIQVFTLGLALYTGYTRIIDGMHHLHDVIVGYIVGALFGYITAKYIAELKTKIDRIEQNEMELQKIEFPLISSNEDITTCKKKRHERPPLRGNT
uniref:AcidPPc domain-containing protein n=1 Tax=Wuchereria bancrofti TaxID=6293 RepID=A0A1I8EGM3_WUCBA